MISIPFGSAILCSILAHVGAVIVVITIINDASAESSDAREIHHEDPPPAPPPPEQEISLGIEESKASTMTFIGYEDYEKHLARLSEVEQAAMREQVAGGAPPASPTPTQSKPETPPETSSQPKQQPEAASPPPRPVSTPAPEAPKSSQEPESSKTSEATPTPDPKPEPTPEPKPETPPTPESPPTPEPKPTPPAPPAPPAPPEPGTPADKDSDASSVVDVPQNLWRQGKPLAAQGLDLKTKRPNIPTVTWLTMRPSFHPVVEIQFMNNGIPASAKVLKSSGDVELDGYINDSLYRWRASGKRLKELQGEETVTIRLKLLLN